jgi:hypothetical protein
MWRGIIRLREEEWRQFRRYARSQGLTVAVWGAHRGGRRPLGARGPAAQENAPARARRHAAAIKTGRGQLSGNGHRPRSGMWTRETALVGSHRRSLRCMGGLLRGRGGGIPTSQSGGPRSLATRPAIGSADQREGSKMRRPESCECHKLIKEQYGGFW